MKHARKNLVALSLLCLPLLAFAGGQGETTEDDMSEEVTLEFYFPGERKIDTDKVLETIEERSRESLNVDLDFTWIPWGDYRNRISVINAAGEPYEAHFDADWFVWGTLAPRGGLADISEMLPEYAPNLASRYSELELASATVNGALTALPWLYPGSQRRAAIVREDLRLEYGVPEIDSYDDLEVYLEAISENEPDLIPFVPQVNDSLIMFADNYGYAILNTALQIVYKWDDPDMDLMTWEETPEFRQAVEMMRRWYTNGYMPNDVLSMQQQPGQLFENGRIAARVHLWQGEQDIKAALKANFPDAEARAFNLYPDKTAHLSPPMNNAVAFNASADQLPRTLQFLEWIHASQANYDLLIYGIEGEHFVDIGPGRFGHPEGVTQADHPYQNWLGQWGFWDIELTRFPPSYPETYRQDYIEDVNMNTQYWPHLGFVPSTEEVRTQVAQRQSIFEERGRALMFGVLDSSEIDSYIQEQENAGSDEIVAEMQRQLDAWRAENQ
ncbi:MAG: extracellular solute-binding protein [Spirochaetales bacterium]